MVPVCDKRYHIYNRFRHFWAEIKKLWNYPLEGMLWSCRGLIIGFILSYKAVVMQSSGLMVKYCVHIHLFNR